MRRILIIIPILLMLSACGTKMAIHPEPKPVESKIIRKATWEVDFRDVYFSDAKNGWIIGDKGMIIHTSDGGKNWETLNSGTDVRLNRIQFTDEKSAWVAGDGGVLLHTLDAGRNWRKQVITDGSIIGLYFLDGYRGWICGEGGVIYYTADGGKAWKFRPSGMGEPLVDIYFVNQQEGWALGQLGIVLHTTDGGNKWKTETIDPYRSFINMQFATDGKVGWAAGIGSALVSTHDGGKTWQDLKAGIENTHAINGLYFSNAKNGWIVWQHEGSGTDKHLYDISYINGIGLIAIDSKCAIVKRTIDKL